MYNYALIFVFFGVRLKNKLVNRGFFLFIVFISVNILISHQVSAQINYKDKSTEKLKKDPDLEPEPSSKKRRLLSIYIKNTTNTLYGNPCMDKVTERFGFEYVVMPSGTTAFGNGFNRFFHNFGTKFLLFFRNPLWGIITKKKYKECRQKTGDYTG